MQEHKTGYMVLQVSTIIENGAWDTLVIAFPAKEPGQSRDNTSNLEAANWSDWQEQDQTS